MNDLTGLVDLVARLRAPDGCPWDREQDLEDLRPYLLEEAHEVAAAIDTRDPVELASELGDLLFQIAFVIRIAEESGLFGAREVVGAIRQKMIDRHPHVFGDTRLDSVSEVARAWETRKAGRREGDSILDGLPVSLPALVASYRLTQRAAAVGFDWPTPAAVVEKIREELGEVLGAMREGEAGGDEAAVREEIGDLLFAVANLARHLEVDPEGALADANLKFGRRFRALEEELREAGSSLQEATLAEMDRLWDDAKRRQREG